MAIKPLIPPPTAEPMGTQPWLDYYFKLTKFTNTLATGPFITDDITSDIKVYPTWVTGYTNNLPINVSHTKYYFNPKTAILTGTLKLTPVVSAVNFVNLSGSIAGSAVTMASFGGDTNIGISISPKGTGAVTMNAPVTVTGLMTGQQGANVSGTVAVTNTANTSLVTLSGRNASAGNAAVCRAMLGNDTSATGFTVDLFGSNHATKPLDVELINRGAGNLVLGTNSAAAVAINSANQAVFSQLSTFNNGISVFGVSAAENSANTIMSSFTGLNTSAGNAAGTRLSLGTNISSTAFTLTTYGSGHTTKPAYVEILNQANAPLILGTSGTAAITISGEGVTALVAGIVLPVRVVTAAGAVTITSADYTVVVNKTVGAATTVNLPTGVTGTVFRIKDGKGDAAANPITITPAAGNIDGAGTLVMSTNRQAVTLQYDGTQWEVL